MMEDAWPMIRRCMEHQQGDVHFFTRPEAESLLLGGARDDASVASRAGLYSRTTGVERSDRGRDDVRPLEWSEDPVEVP